MSERRRACGGFSLVELIVVIVVIGLALITIAQMLAYGTGRSADTLLETRAHALAQAYLDEILSRRFDENSHPGGRIPCVGADPGSCTPAASLGPDAGEFNADGLIRDRADDVDDYHGLREGDGEVQPLRDAEGLERAGYENFRVSVTVRYAGGDAPPGQAPADAKLVTVEVQHREQDVPTAFSVYKGNY